MKKIVGLLFATFSFGAAPSALAKPPSPKSGTGEKTSAATQQVAVNESRAVDAAQLFSDGKSTSAVFRVADRDRDGSVSFDEFAEAVNDSVARRVAARFNQLDRNRDGRCSRSEVNKMSAARFARFDADSDGFFSANELGSYMKSLVSGRLAQVYARLDVDGDGRFNVAELTPAPKQAPAKVASQKSQTSSDVARNDSASVY
jgi:Ca2+-binding EF-hand superfamily protein